MYLNGTISELDPVGESLLLWWGIKPFLVVFANLTIHSIYETSHADWPINNEQLYRS